MASLANPSLSNNLLNSTWTNVYQSAPASGFTGTVRIVVEVNAARVKLTNTTGITAITQGYGNLTDGSAKSIAFEGTQDAVNSALQSLQVYSDYTNGQTSLNISAIKGGSAYNPTNKHYYQAVYVAGGISWVDAKAAAEKLTFNGLTGYLATVTSADENSFILSKLPADGWIGGTDQASEGVWKWATGPEAGQTFWTGVANGSSGSAYANWNPNEPNNYNHNANGEDYAQFYASNGSGQWNDLPDANVGAGKLTYYVVEYGGIGTPAEQATIDQTTLTIVDAPIITSNGGGDTSTINYAENGTGAVTTVTATDANTNDTKTYSLSGTDADDFSISTSGVLTFKTTPNFETPTDSDGNNSYVVTVTVKDGANLTDTQALTVNVTNVNDLPTTGGSLPTSIAAMEDVAADVDLSALSFGDQDASDSFTLKLAASKGILAATGAGGVTVVGNGSNTLTLTGTPAAVTTFLDTASNIQYTGALNDNGSPAATIAVSYKDSAMASFLALGSAIPVNIAAVNDAPVIASANTAATLPGIREDQTSATNAGATVTSLFAPRFTDVDSGDSLSGIVVVGDASSATEGTWQYSTDSGAVWNDIGTVSTSSGLALSSTTQLRFAPALNWNGTPGDLTVKLLDKTQAIFTSGSTKVSFDTTVNAASSAASSNAVSLTTSVAAVNDLPTFDSTKPAPTGTATETAIADTTVTLTATAGSEVKDGKLAGTLAASDVEDGTNVTYGIRGGTGTTTITKTGFYGTLSLNTTTKEWTYIPNNFIAINALNDGQTAADAFEFSITDAAGATASQGLTITYTGTNDTPLVKAGAAPIPDQTFNGNGSWSYQIPADIFTDADGTNLSYTIQVVDGSGNLLDTIGATTGSDASKPSNWLIFNEASRALSGIPTATAPLPLNIKVTATDGTGSVSDTFTVTLDQPTSGTGTATNAAPISTDDRVLTAVNTEIVLAITRACHQS